MTENALEIAFLNEGGAESGAQLLAVLKDDILLALITAWDALSPPIKAAIIAMVESSSPRLAEPLRDGKPLILVEAWLRLPESIKTTIAAMMATVDALPSFNSKQPLRLMHRNCLAALIEASEPLTGTETARAAGYESESRVRACLAEMVKAGFIRKVKGEGYRPTDKGIAALERELA